MRRALFAGTFNPFTIGHADIVKRGLELFDEVVIAIGENQDKPSADIDARLQAIRAIYKDEAFLMEKLHDMYDVQVQNYRKAMEIS